MVKMQDRCRKIAENVLIIYVLDFTLE